MQDIYDLLTNKIDKTKVRVDEPMNKHTSFRIGGPADIFVKADNISELKYILEVTNNTNTPITIVRKRNKSINKRSEELEELL